MQALEIVAANPNKFRLVGLSGGRKNPQLLYLANMPLFDIDYWERRKRKESEQEEITEIQDYHTEIEQIWIFCIFINTYFST